MTNLEIYGFTKNTDLRCRTTTAIAKTAQYVLASNLTGNVRVHAMNAARAPESYVEWFIWYVVLNTTIQADPTDDARRMQAGNEKRPASGKDHRWGPASAGP